MFPRLLIWCWKLSWNLWYWYLPYILKCKLPILPYFQPCCIPLLMRGNYSTKTIYFLLSTKKRFTLLVCSADDAKGPYPSNFSILQTNTVYFQYSFQVPWCFAGSRFWKISFYHTFWIFHCNSFYLKVISKSLISFTFQSELRYGKSREFICKVASIH